MHVFKFGGASVNSEERIRNLASILQKNQEFPLMIIVSAMGKTTNALEKVAEAFFAGNKAEALSLFEQVKNQHLHTAGKLLVTHYSDCASRLNDFFTEVEWLLHDEPVREYDYYYDQVVCAGELFSTAIISAYLNESGLQNQWLDVRDIIRTDDNFRDAGINWNFTRQQVEHLVLPALNSHRMLITQGFIGATDENESTTLGREGSDYTAAVFANMLNASGLTIWKDVESVMNADPRQFPDAVPLPELNYSEVIEMAYYGAQVIHPKTIKPLQNKDIPLYVKCFLNPALPGTVIHHKPLPPLPPVIVWKDNQVMMEMSTLDFSFIGEQYVGRIYQLLEELHIKPNLTQNGAISFICVLDDKPEKIEKLALAAAGELHVQVTKNLAVLTVRHATAGLVESLQQGKKQLLRQESSGTIQCLLA